MLLDYEAKARKIVSVLIDSVYSYDDLAWFDLHRMLKTVLCKLCAEEINSTTDHPSDRTIFSLIALD